MYRMHSNFQGVLYFADFLGKFDPRKLLLCFLYFITHENFKIRTKTKNHENLLPRKLRRVRYVLS